MYKRKRINTQSNNVSGHLMASWDFLGQFPMKEICILGQCQWTYKEDKVSLTAEGPPLLYGRRRGKHGGRLPSSILKHHARGQRCYRNELQCGRVFSTWLGYDDKVIWSSWGGGSLRGIYESGLDFGDEWHSKSLGLGTLNWGHSTCRRWNALSILKSRWAFSQRELLGDYC